MRSAFYILTLTFTFTLAGLPLAAQPKGAEPVKWHPVIGHQKEAIIFMPAGFKVLVDDNVKNFGSRGTKLVTVKKTVRVARLFNGTLLLMNYYEASGPAYYETLSGVNGLAAVGENTAGDFTVKRFAGKVKGEFKKTHYFVGKDGLYEATAFSRDENDPIVEAFFASVRIAHGDTYLAPNAKDGDTSTSLPRLIEKQPERSPDSVQIPESQADRYAIVLFQPSFRTMPDPGSLPQAGRVTATALLSASGIVEDVKVTGTASLDIQRAFADTVKKTVFIPAEKDGKLVSVFKTFTWEMTVEIRGGGPFRMQ
jgi:hypothetical protein